ncbi:hypothetical protein MSG28_005471 [Choristoneura fumiferana]|uniref:Uncharacterized protein n=1 Tax=Choristoneura fumiferana TaxID=7141 RepID=A0ACC0KZS1_CHOFU|nr:hypothetical protein MSG28_005471 [Choristoneura fumiferana]
MAVYAAHLTRTLQGTPSVFQVAAQEALGATVKPAFRKVFEYLAAVYPDKSASFSESFYGLVRVPLRAGGEFAGGPRLPPASEMGSLLALALLPYLRDRAERAVQAWREREEDGTLGKGYSASARRAAIHLYSTVHFLSSTARLIQLARYLVGGSATPPTPELAALGLTLRDAPPQDQDDTWADLFRSLATGNLSSAVVSFPMVGSAALRAVEYGAFAVQFLRWWESRAPPRRRARAAAAPARRHLPLYQQVSVVPAALEDARGAACLWADILLRVHLPARARARHVPGHALPRRSGLPRQDVLGLTTAESRRDIPKYSH